MLSHDFDPTIVDNDGNTFVHHLSKHNVPIILKTALNKFPELVDMPNKKSETPAIICCKNSQEDMFYILKSKGCSMEFVDYYGNTCYHYIVLNSMCIGMTIMNARNRFGITPENYSKISPKYYHFIPV